MTTRINALNFGLASGILWGLTVFVMTYLAIWVNYGTMFLTLLMDIYPGYDIGLIGSFVGLLYGFADGFLGFFLLGWLYNLLNDRCGKES